MTSLPSWGTTGVPGVDQISVFRKMTVFERAGDRVMTLMTSGNLAVSQAVLNALTRPRPEGCETLWSAPDLFEAACVVGAAVREVYRHEAAALHEQHVDFNVSLIFGGQIGAERCRLFQVYSAGNFIEATHENPYFQIGEAKYGKPIIDRVIQPNTPLGEAAKCALISMDSTLRSNISCGLPLDLLVYEADALRVVLGGGGELVHLQVVGDPTFVQPRVGEVGDGREGHDAGDDELDGLGLHRGTPRGTRPRSLRESDARVLFWDGFGADRYKLY